MLTETVPVSIFYVSSSPWNLFDYLVPCQKVHALPQGPILLRDWDLNRATSSSSAHKSHKASSIDGLIDFYLEMGFALIGDTPRPTPSPTPRWCKSTPGE